MKTPAGNKFSKKITINVRNFLNVIFISIFFLNFFSAMSFFLSFLTLTTCCKRKEIGLIYRLQCGRKLILPRQ